MGLFFFESLLKITTPTSVTLRFKGHIYVSKYGHYIRNIVSFSKIG